MSDSKSTIGASKLLGILSDSERVHFYSRPEFSHKERLLYFLYNDKEFEYFKGKTTLEARVYFILQLGYFKAKRRFFSFQFQNVAKDVELILARYFPGEHLSRTRKAPARSTILRQQNIILNHFQYSDYKDKKDVFFNKQGNSIVMIMSLKE